MKNTLESYGGRVDIRQKLPDDAVLKEAETLNKKSTEAVARIKAKLQGNDFRNYPNLSTVNQVDALISQASSDENVCQAYLGWNPFL
jgi:FKBP12-rapamycin complex-associated protein